MSEKAENGGAGDTQEARPLPVSFSEALRWWFRLGLISFGGPAGQISIMHQELVDKRRWISEKRFLHALNYCMLLPGPEAQQLATYIGWLMHGTRGGIAAGALFVLPSLVILIALSWLYMSLGPAHAERWLYGIKPAVIAVVLFAAWRIGSRVLKGPLPALIALSSLAAIALLSIPFPLVVVAAAVAGWLLRDRFSGGNAHAASAAGRHLPALIDDDTPPPAHARYERARLLRYLAIGLALWGFAMAALASLPQAWQGLTAMAAFFSKAALVTIGGAYAVMPYVFQQAVEHYAWLTPAQMLDGLALGETTPGPLIMVVAFIGFVGAWGQAAAGHALAGVAGACVATFFTFLPSFLFILVGGPLVERTRDDFRLAGPLNAVTAAVVGAIICLGLSLAGHVFWPQGWTAPPDWPALALSAVALLAMMRNWLGMIPVILLSGALGAAWRFIA